MDSTDGLTDSKCIDELKRKTFNPRGTGEEIRDRGPGNVTWKLPLWCAAVAKEKLDIYVIFFKKKKKKSVFGIEDSFGEQNTGQFINNFYSDPYVMSLAFQKTGLIIWRSRS